MADQVVECAQRTLAVESARIELVQELEFSLPERDQRPRRRGGLLRPLIEWAGDVGTRAFERWANDRMGELRYEGFIEPSRRMYMHSAGSWSELYADGVRWGGRAGTPLAMLNPSPHRGSALDLWWLLDGLRGTIEARAEAEESVRGAPCRRLAARVDLARASAAAGGGLRPPTVERFEELLALPLDVWIDGTHVRRVRYGNWIGHGKGALALELWDFGVSTDHLDWSRLPAWQAAP